MKEKAVASAPGKVILFGEHFVVSGYPAIVTAIDMRARAVLTPSHDKFKIKSGQSWAAWNAEGEQIYPPPPQPTPFQPLFNMVLKIMEDHGVSACFNAEILSEIPGAAGLGSSAAVSVSLAKAVAAFNNIDMSLESVIHYSMLAEKEYHGRPSGIDSHITALGGTLVYNGPRKCQQLQLNKHPSIFIAYTGLRRKTSKMVSYVQNFAAEKPDEFGQLSEIYSEIFRRAVNALKSNDLCSLGRLMTINHFLLRCLGLSNEKVERAVEKLLEKGAYGVKITGAGGGGCVIAVGDHELFENVSGFFPGFWKSSTGCKGVDVEA
ncbi:MAG: mevalonate kinase [Candidatus Caldarchaeum sp.]